MVSPNNKKRIAVCVVADALAISVMGLTIATMVHSVENREITNWAWKHLIADAGRSRAQLGLYSSQILGFSIGALSCAFFVAALTPLTIIKFRLARRNVWWRSPVWLTLVGVGMLCCCWQILTVVDSTKWALDATRSTAARFFSKSADGSTEDAARFKTYYASSNCPRPRAKFPQCTHRVHVPDCTLTSDADDHTVEFFPVLVRTSCGPNSSYAATAEAQLAEEQMCEQCRTASAAHTMRDEFCRCHGAMSRTVNVKIDPGREVVDYQHKLAISSLVLAACTLAVLLYWGIFGKNRLAPSTSASSTDAERGALVSASA